MLVKVYSINTTEGMRYGLKNANSGNILNNATAKWKTVQSAEKYAAKMDYTIAGK